MKTVNDKDQLPPTDEEAVRQHHRLATEGLSDMKKAKVKKPMKMPKAPKKGY